MHVKVWQNTDYPFWIETNHTGELSKAAYQKVEFESNEAVTACVLNDHGKRTIFNYAALIMTCLRTCYIEFQKNHRI